MIFSGGFHRLCCTGTVALAITVGANANAALTISGKHTAFVSCVSGVCTATAANAIMNKDDLETMLDSSNVQLVPGSVAMNIAVDAPITWASTYGLYLDAFQSIVVGKSISDNGTGSLTLRIDDGATDGALSITSKGSVSFLGTSNALTINRRSYTLVNNIATLASDISANPSGLYALASNYNAAVDGTYSQSPIATNFKGTFQGLGNTISNLSINHSTGEVMVGLFAKLAATGAIKNLRLSKIQYSDSDSGYGYVAGLVGDNSDRLSGDDVEGSIQSSEDAAGLVITNEQSGTIEFSSARVFVQAGQGAGGLVDENFGSILLSRALSKVNGTTGAGGLANLNEGSISQSYATGNVEGAGGGLVNIQEAPGTISDSYSTGEVFGTGGGFINSDTQTSTSITTSYSAGGVQASDGGFACQIVANAASNDYWNTSTSGTTFGECGNANASGITGLTNGEFQSGLPPGFDSSIWAETPVTNNGLPYLIANPPAR
jgi:hypothetical protein